MKTIHFTLIALGLVLVAAPAAAQNVLTADTPYTLTAIQEEGQWKWVNDAGDINPTLIATAGESYTINACADETTIPHNIKVGDEPVSDTFQEGECLEYTFTMSEGSVDYVCTIHPTTMLGSISTTGAAVDGGNGAANGGADDGNDTPAPGLLGAAIALIGAALVLRRK